jgi:diadenosine tetraphosphate (Ap4A) HIT family hydrolase
MRVWPDHWDRLRGGDACPMCAEGRPELAHGRNARIQSGRVSDAYLARNDVGQRGYAVVIWRGRHVAEPTELTADEAARYFAEVLAVSRALEAHYKPAKMNLMMLGNTVPHLHTHVIPRYITDDSPGIPPRFMREFPPAKEPLLPEAEYEADVRALRELTSRP